MKKCFLLISVLFLLFISIPAQTDSEKTIEWKLLSPRNEEFSVEAPDNLVPFSMGNRNENRRYNRQVGKTVFFIFSDSRREDFQFRETMKFIKTTQKVEFEKQANSDEMKFIFSDDEDFYHTIYTVKTKKRAYIFHLVSEEKDDPNVKRFFKNLKVNEKSAGIESENEAVEKSSEVETKKVPEQQKTTQGTGRGSGIGNGVGNGEGAGFGNGSGIGRGSGVGNGANSGSQNNENKVSDNKDLYITFKPKPRYTDFARFYGILGSVRVKVTFLKNGTIGSVTPVTKLPFGLTKSAIQVAKQMRFDPKIVNGKPVAVTKVVVFNFTLY